MRKIIVCGHSMAAPRQQRFWEFFASLGHEVHVLAPKVWMMHKVVDMERGSFSMKGINFIGWARRIRGFLNLAEEVNPDWVYLNDEADVGQVLQACQVKKDIRFKLALFSWDNILHLYGWEKLIDQIDLFIPGCQGAKEILIQKGVDVSKITDCILQVGVDCNLFRPLECDKEFDTVTCAGFTENKGITDIKKVVKQLGLKHLWLGGSRPYDRLSEPLDYGYAPGWMNYEELPKWYNKAKVHVLFSRDTPEWKEQNAPYANLEALACGLNVVMTKAGDAPYFLEGCKAALLIPQNDVDALKDGIIETLNYSGESGTKFVIENFSYEKIAQKLVRVFGNAWP